MNTKNNTKLKKLSKYFNLIDNKLVYSNKTIDRYKNSNENMSYKNNTHLEDLRNSIKRIKNCNLKKCN